MSDEIAYATIRELGTRYRSRQLSPVEVTQALLARIEKHDPVLSAFVTVFRRFAKTDNGELGSGVLPIGPWEIARLDNDEIEVEAYQRQVDRMARELAERLPAGAKCLNFSVGRGIVRCDGPIRTLRDDRFTAHEVVESAAERIRLRDAQRQRSLVGRGRPFDELEEIEKIGRLHLVFERDRLRSYMRRRGAREGCDQQAPACESPGHRHQNLVVSISRMLRSNSSKPRATGLNSA